MTATVLVVDDMDSNIKLLQAKLLSEYYTVLTSNSAEEAFKIIASNRVDIILMDVMMPIMDGITACRKIKENPNTSYIPLIMVTALSEIEDRVRALEAGADDFLTKPVDYVELFARVKSLTRMKSILDELKLRNQTNQTVGGVSINIDDDITKTKIIILDDDLIQSKNIAKILTNIVGEVKIFNNLLNFETFLENYQPDIAMISCQMNGVDPLRVCVKLRSKEDLKHTSIILISEENELDVIIKGMEIGINDYFITPIDNNELIARVKTQLRKKIYIDKLKADLEQNFNLSIKDSLTNIFNRRYFDNHIKLMIESAKQSSKNLSVIMLDIDDFKSVNDIYGHQAGDELLKSISDILIGNLRVTDLVSRYGGDEFVILIPDLSISDVLKICERLKSKIEKTNFNIPGQSAIIKKTISMGVAEYKNQSVKQFIEEADKALYNSKGAGKNQVSIISLISNP